MDGGSILTSFVESDSEELLHVRWLPLESPSAQLARCTLTNELKVATEIDFENIPRLFNASSSPPRSSVKMSPMVAKSKRSRCIESDLMDAFSIIPSSPSIPLRSYFFYLSPNVYCSEDRLGSKSRKFADNFARPAFAHWNLQSGPAAPGKMRRAVSEFSERTLIAAPSSDFSTLLNGNIGITPVLPCFDSPRDAIKRISPTTMACALNGDFARLYKKMVIVDCRYPYEYHGGHIPGAINVCDLESIDRVLFEEEDLTESHSTVVIFHCEFSSERAPRMALHVRNFDRVLNASNYPHLNYPQMYVLDGGYKNYYLQFPEQCNPPRQYVPMRNVGHRDELRHHQRLKFHDGQINGKHRHKLRSCSLRKSHSIAMPHPVTAISSFLRNRDNVTQVCLQPVDLLSSDIGDICDQGDPTECFLITTEHDGRVSK
ncbi:M-phase inducer phosphatase 1-B [Paramicrosporidium saccamoebae]|uniref:M-phase inducer phosphatase n=1 Tax=Paramicrosporidium saccamoebae TaxID=1246581 RepID=A0A2H9TN99_9FUNG|nr:M-phase inducer phosphatase 1-B [Paramicrosporidium saccamoebae]